MQKIIFKQGRVRLAIAANESVAVYTQDSATVSREVGNPNRPPTISQLGVVANGQTVFGPYSSGATIIIEAGAAPVLYETGVNPVVQSAMALNSGIQLDPGVLNATGALTAAMMLAGLVTSTTAAAVAGTVPTGTVMEQASEFAINDAFEWSVINTGANAFTVTAAAGHTLVGNAVVAAGKAGSFRTRKTALNTFVTYSLANT